MADRVKGITIEIGGDTTGLSKALGGVNKEIKSTQSQLKDVERLLKLDPTNTNLLQQKQKLLAKSVEETRDKLKTLKDASEQAAKTADKYDDWKKAYDPIQAEIETTNKSLVKLKAQQQEMQDCGEIDTDAYKQLTEKAEEANKKLRDLREQAKAVSDEFGHPISPEQYDSLQREIIETEQRLKSLKEESKDFGSVIAQQMKVAGERVQEVGGKISEAGGKISGAGNKLLPATAAVTGLGVAAFNAASDMAESENKVDVSFNNSAQKIKDFASTTLEAYGIASGTSMDMAAQFGDMATSMGLTTNEAADMSMRLVGLSGDLASFKNIGVDQAMSALNGIFTGETESLKSLGVVMTQDNLLQFAIKNGMIDTAKSASQLQKEQLALEKAQVAYNEAVKKHGVNSLEARDAALKMSNAEATLNESAKATLDSLSQEEMVQLRYAYVLNATKNAQGDFSRTSDGTANSMRVMQESLKEAAAAFGEQLLPIITPIIQKITELIKWFTNLDESQKKTILTIAGIVAAVGPVLIVIGNVVSAIGNITTGIGGFMKALPKVQGAFKAFWGTLSANPIVLIIAYIVAIVAALVTLYNKCEWFRDGVNAIFGAVKDFFVSVWDGICGFFTETIPGALDSVVGFFQGIPDWWRGIWQNVSNTVAEKWEEVRENVVTGADAMQGGIQALDDYLQGVFATDWTETFGPVLGGALNNFFDNVSGIWDGIKSTMDGVIETIKGVFTGDWEQAWNGVKEIFSGIFSALYDIAVDPLNAIIGFINTIIDGINWVISGLNHIPSVNFSTVGKIPFMANGGTLLHGSAIVGEAGPELLTVAGGKAVVQPLSTNTSRIEGLLGDIAGTIGKSSGYEQPFVVKVMIDDDEIGRAAFKYSSRRSQAYGE